jgi:hypothetical protein
MSQALSYTGYSARTSPAGHAAYRNAAARPRSSRVGSGVPNWLRLIATTALATAIFVVWLFLLREAFISVAAAMFHMPQIHYGMN